MRACQAGPFSQFGAEACCCPGRPGRLSALSVFLCKSVFYGVFVWARRALNSQKTVSGWRTGGRGAGRRPLSPAQVAQFVWEGHLIMPLDDLGAEVNLG